MRRDWVSINFNAFNFSANDKTSSALDWRSNCFQSNPPVAVEVEGMSWLIPRKIERWKERKRWIER